MGSTERHRDKHKMKQKSPVEAGGAAMAAATLLLQQASAAMAEGNRCETASGDGDRGQRGRWQRAVATVLTEGGGNARWKIGRR